MKTFLIISFAILFAGLALLVGWANGVDFAARGEALGNLVAISIATGILGGIIGHHIP